MKTCLVLAALACAAPLAAAPAQAALIYAGTYSGTDCSGPGGFPNCRATTTGTQQGGQGDASVYKRDSNGSQAFGGFPSVTGGEFSITYKSADNTLSFTYLPGASDPELHYVAVKQANGYALFYDLLQPITSAVINLGSYFPNNPGFSHISFFGHAASPAAVVPEPGSLALLAAGLVGLGVVARRRRGALVTR